MQTFPDPRFLQISLRDITAWPYTFFDVVVIYVFIIISFYFIYLFRIYIIKYRTV